MLHSAVCTQVRKYSLVREHEFSELRDLSSVAIDDVIKQNARRRKILSTSAQTGWARTWTCTLAATRGERRKDFMSCAPQNQNNAARLTGVLVAAAQDRPELQRWLFSGISRLCAGWLAATRSNSSSTTAVRVAESVYLAVSGMHAACFLRFEVNAASVPVLGPGIKLFRKPRIVYFNQFGAWCMNTAIL